MESDGRIRSKDIGTGEVNSRALDNIRSSNYNGSHTDPDTDPGTEGWQILKNGVVVFNNAIIRGVLRAAEIISGTLTVKSGGSIEVEDSVGTVIVTLDENGLSVAGTDISPPPIGAIMAYGGSSSPLGYLLCQGQAVNRTTYAGLFGVVGTVYGVGDGSTTFNLPNLQQRFPLGKATSGTGDTLGATGGVIDHTHSGPSHSHSQGDTGSGGSHDHSFSDSFSTGAPSFNVAQTRGSDATFNHPSTTHDHSGSVSGTTGSNGSHAHSNSSTGSAGTGATGSAGTLPPFQVVNYIIKH